VRFGTASVVAASVGPVTDRLADVLEFADADAWDGWLAEHAPHQTSAWLRIRKARSSVSLIAIRDAGDVALCHGWIDGHRKGFDDDSFLQRYSRRTRTSSWSRVNVDRAEALIAAGRMRPQGLLEIEAARADGRWDSAYESQRHAEPPPDLVAGLAGDDRARAAFDALGRSEQYAVILPILKARTAVARAKVVARAVERLAGRQGSGQASAT
jgi:uncharacterized protein YdeI (YjbR/CyaY-like superfamily)